MLDIIPVVTIPHTGNNTIIKTIDPEGSEILQTLCKNYPKTTKEILDQEIQSKGLKYGYVLLEALAKENNIEESVFLYKDRSNIVYGHPAPYYRAGKDINYIQTIEIIKILSEYNQIIMPMRDPLLSLMSSEIRLYKRKEKVEIIKPINHIGKVLENICWGLPIQSYIDMVRHIRPRAKITRIEIIRGMPNAQNISGKPSEHEDIEDTDYKDYTLEELLKLEKDPNGKKPIFGSNNTRPSDNLMPSQLFMWKLWAEEIDKLNPFYVFMDLEGRNSKYRDIDFTCMNNYNYAGNHPLRQAYNNRDLHCIATYLKDNLKALMNMESILRPPLEKLGYKNLLWWKA